VRRGFVMHTADHGSHICDAPKRMVKEYATRLSFTLGKFSQLNTTKEG
jgi:hypothetical protein